MAYTKVAPSRNATASIKYARDGKDKGEDKCVAMRGLNCDPSNAEYLFDVVRRVHRKAMNDNEDIQARTIIQSFKGTELSAEEVNEIGFETAERLNERLGDGFQAVVYTHGNTGNYHNHIIFNSVNCDTGKKYTLHYEKFEVEKISDQILVERGLETIDKQKEDIVTLTEKKRRAEGKYVWKDDLKERISTALDKTLENYSETKDNIAEFKENLLKLGVDVRERYVKKRDETLYSYGFTDEDGKKRVNKQKSLGKKYSAERILSTIERHKENIKEKGQEDLFETEIGLNELKTAKKQSGFVEPMEVERKRKDFIKKDEKEVKIDVKNDIFIQKEENKSIPPDPFGEYLKKEEEMKKQLALSDYLQSRGLSYDSEFREMVVYNKNTNEFKPYREISKNINGFRYHHNLSTIDREFEFEIYTSPKNKLLEGKFNADFGHSFKEQVEKIAEKQGVLDEYKAEHRIIITNSKKNKIENKKIYDIL